MRRLRVAATLKRLIGVRRYATTPGVELDKKWREKWELKPSRHARDNSNGDKYYALSMFPYPSGSLHIGHLRVYTISDVLARYRRMKGYNVIHAMGWDAFGLPAENAAIERGIDPREWTLSNIQSMKQQMKEMSADFDWEREVVSCSPEYYKWTQKLFIMMYENGLAYRKEAKVNWDPIEQTVLANEQVDDEGKSWRSGAIVEQKNLNQWFLGITKYAPELIEDLDKLDQWPSKVKTMQRNWIGKSDGANLTLKAENEKNSVTTFTTRPDTLFGLQYVALAVDHPIVLRLAAHDSKIAGFLKRASTLPEDTKEGLKLDFKLSSPLDPSNFNIPVFIAPYVISDYGHGSVMGCPAHDTRDFEFWKLNMPASEPVAVVITPPADFEGGIYTGKEGTLNDKNGKYSGMSSKQGGRAIIDDLEKTGTGLAKHASQYKLRDWLISRQRFWGAPIPMVHCDDCGIVPVPDEQLPVKLPGNLSSAAAPLAQNEEFLNTECPSCHKSARRDSDTMDTFMDSSWYFFRYTDAKNSKEIFNHSKASELMPVDIYLGGIEHAILHLLYSRFVAKFLKSCGAWDGGPLNGEPLKRLVTQGMVHGKTFTDPATGRFLKPDEVDKSNPETPIVKENGKIANVSSEKMSKSKYNGADPGACIANHGADATRAHILFQAPVPDVLNWEESKIVGIERWLARVQQVVESVKNVQVEPISFDKLKGNEFKFWGDVQEKLNSITIALHDQLTLNTLISDYMKLTRVIQEAIDNNNVDQKVVAAAVDSFVKIISPVVPATAEECWQELGHSDTIFAESWPEAQQQPVRHDVVVYNVIINGKRRLELEVEDGMLINDVVELAKTKGESWIQGREITRVVTPPNKKLVNIITAKK